MHEFGLCEGVLDAVQKRAAGRQVAGIRGVHLVYELLDGCDLFVLVDAAPRGYEPGTITVLEVDPDDAGPGAPVMDGHGLSPDDLFAMLATMGGRPGRSLLVACEPADVSAGMELSEPVRAALPHAVRAVEEILSQIGQKEGVRDGAQADHGGGDSDGGRSGGGRPAGH